MPSRSAHSSDSRIRAVLGPTNTGKTHLAIERLCGHSSGAIGFPLRLLAREVYDKVCAIKGEAACALITGEERIEPPNARYFLCTAEAMPRNGWSNEGGKAFLALDEAQLAADRERGHIFTDRLLNARGREETMLLGSATLEPMVRALVPEAQIEERPRFSTLSHAGSTKLSRLPARSAIVAFSVEQVYQVAELLRRFRGGAAVVMGALSPQTRNRQVELFQSGEVDYIVATDAIGMGLNLDVHHVAFAALSKFDGVRKRRLTPAEMAQIAGRAGRHQTDGTFGTMSGGGRGRTGSPLEFTEDEVFAIEQHRFAPVTKLFWREAQPRFDSIDLLIGDLEAPPRQEGLAPAPEAIDLAVLKRLSEQRDVVDGIAQPDSVRRFWEVCQLPDFRQLGPEGHSRFVARLWADLREGHIGADFVAARIGELGNMAGDIDTLQGRLSAIRSWAYICQRPDWVLARDEMAARARAAEAKLSDALHQKLTERFVNRRTAVLMRGMGKDAGLLRVELQNDGKVTVEGQPIGHLEGFRFVVDDTASTEDRKLMLAAAEKHMPSLLAQKAATLIGEELGELRIAGGQVMRGDQTVAALEKGKYAAAPRLVMAKELGQMDPAHRSRLEEALQLWLVQQLAPLAALRGLEEAANDPDTGTEVRALLLTLAERGGTVRREDAGLAHVPKEKRPLLRRLGVIIGSLDVYMPAMLKPAPRQLLRELGVDRRDLREAMEAVIEGGKQLPAGYRNAGNQAIRIDMAEKLFRAAHEQRAKAQTAQDKSSRGFSVDVALATSMGLAAENFLALMKDAGFRKGEAVLLADSMFGPPRPAPWTWRAPRKDSLQNVRPRRRGGNRKPAEKGGNNQSGKRPEKGSTSANRAQGGESRRKPPAPRKPASGPATSKALAGLADLLKG
ncbi:helicase-related protein [Aurantiacibacter marinus]|uniref:Helicase n=1 Tax=Aurantiacibacter marinus TaxID=874156 RepID=A0A0H0XWR2_9SPHN|nr:helicase-related protein [Aurantiacibacter marinus]KLI64760.1 helicase [Aurantiacibacter marinus]